MKKQEQTFEDIIYLAMSCDTARNSPLGWFGDYRDEDEIRKDLVGQVKKIALKRAEKVIDRVKEQYPKDVFSSSHKGAKFARILLKNVKQALREEFGERGKDDNDKIRQKDLLEAIIQNKLIEKEINE